MWEVPTGHQRDGTRTVLAESEPAVPSRLHHPLRAVSIATRRWRDVTEDACRAVGVAFLPLEHHATPANDGSRRLLPGTAFLQNIGCQSAFGALGASGKAIIIKRKRPTWHTAQVGRLSLPDREGDRMLEPASSPHDTCVCSFAYLVLLRIHGTTPEKPAGLDDRPIRANAFERAHTSPDATQLRGHACARLERSRSHAVE